MAVKHKKSNKSSKTSARASRSSSSRSRSSSRRTSARSSTRSTTPRSGAVRSRGTASRKRSAPRASSRRKSKITTDHDQIRRWAEERGAQPACVKGTGDRGDVGMLRLDFPGYSGAESLQPISWDDWFEKFDERNLALLYEDTLASGERSNFNKLVSREGETDYQV
jgi:hypothetical protein